MVPWWLPWLLFVQVPFSRLLVRFKEVQENAVLFKEVLQQQVDNNSLLLWEFLDGFPIDSFSTSTQRLSLSLPCVDLVLER